MTNDRGKFRNPLEGIRPDRPGRTEPAGRADGGAGRIDRPQADGAARPPQEGFRQPLPDNLSRMATAIMQKMDGAGALILKLPGLARIIHDKRLIAALAEKVAENAKNEADKADAAKKELQIKGGKAEEAGHKTYENYLAARQMVQPKERQASDQQARALSEFEKQLVARFENGKELEQAIKDGKLKFLEKTVEQWKAFFDKFAGRTAKKSVDLSEVQEFLFRGLVKKDAAKAVMISDIIHASGRTEKFARFGVLYDKISNFLSKLIPGDRFKSASIADGLTSEELLYLALLPPSLEQEMTTGMKPKQGIFGAESMEARVAEELGISDGRGGPGPGERGGVAGKGKKRKGGFFGMFAGEDEVPLDTSPQFIPWWSWGKLNRPGGMKLKRAFYAGVIITFVIIIILLIDRLLLK